MSCVRGKDILFFFFFALVAGKGEKLFLLLGLLLSLAGRHVELG